jgi:hypothetical protein
MKKKIFTLLITGIFLLPSCYAIEEPNRLPNKDSNEAGMYIEFLKQGASKPDFNNISGEVGVVIINIPSDTNKVFVYVDEVQIGKWIRDDIFEVENETGCFGFESDSFSNGKHIVKLVSINSIGEIKNYPLIDAYFKNLIYNVHCDEDFHPTRDYHYSGFYDGDKPLEVKLTNYNGDDVLWSNTYNGNYIDINIPGSVFETKQLCELKITDGSISITKTLGKEFRRKDIGLNDEETTGKETDAQRKIEEANRPK